MTNGQYYFGGSEIRSNDTEKQVEVMLNNFGGSDFLYDNVCKSVYLCDCASDRCEKCIKKWLTSERKEHNEND